MPPDELSSQDPDTQSSPEGSLPGHDADELEDEFERLRSGDWDPFEETPIPAEHSGGAVDDEGGGHLRSFLEQQLQERPLPTLLLAVAAGWLVGKLLR